MKIKSSVSKRCPTCKLVKRHNHIYIYCVKFKKHKQKQA